MYPLWRRIPLVGHGPGYHVCGAKKFSLSKAASRKPADVSEEIAKCDAVCANCHRIRTHARGAFGGVNSPRFTRRRNSPELASPPPLVIVPRAGSPDTGAEAP